MQNEHTLDQGVTTVQLNHTAVYASDRSLSAEFLAAVLAWRWAHRSAPSCPSTSVTG